MLFLAILVLGLSAGWAARQLLGRDLSWAATLALGLAGSLVGGIVLSLLMGDGFGLHLSGILGSIGGAVILLWLGGLIFGRSRRTRGRARHAR